ncbi:uncharacterized protein LOC101863591 [Aplysia californica]|uniref:Uncharacterized protein LOC101863591 n=1 Tax=Aplysia californica TaxID=6500 RepID=A0ABM1VUZ1_APLCA|nr:uncharacterized protein LOC101863591 [Aplysia californica]
MTVFEWEVGVTRGLEFHLSYCQQSCPSDPQTKFKYSTVKCAPCSCSQSCSLYGTCCPSKYRDWAENIFSVVDRNLENLTTADQDGEGISSDDKSLFDILQRPDCSRLDFYPHDVFARAVCPEGESNATLRHMCEKSPCDSLRGCTPVRHRDTGTVYKNVFCLVCNTLHVGDHHHGLGDLGVTPFYNTRGDHNTEYVEGTLEITCEHYQMLYSVMSEDELFHESSVCESALCAPGKQLEASGQCSTAVDNIRGLGYKLAVTLTPDDIDNFGEDLLTPIRLLMISRLEDPLSEHETQINFTLYVKSCDAHEANDVPILKSVSFTSYIINRSKMSRDDTEKKMLDMVSKQWDVHVDYLNETFFTLKPKIVGYSLHERRSHSVSQNCSPVELSFFKPSYRAEVYGWQPNFSSTIIPNVTSSSPLTLPQGYFEEKTLVLTFDFADFHRFPKDQWSNKNGFIDITSAIFCPFVEVRVLETLVQTTEQITFRIRFEDRVIDVLYDKDSVTYVDEDTIHICVDRFKELIKLPKTRASSYETAERVHYYFEVSCFSVSTACLILTLLTYCLFPGLRSVPGKNNMALCLSLALAQISLLVSVEPGARGWLPPIACATNALLVHFAWLSAFAWMSVCCFHMYRVFSSSTAPSHVSAHSNKRRYRYYFLIAHGSSCLLVLATVLVHLSLTGGCSYGYDTVTCFLDTSGSGVSFVLSLLVPLCAMIVCNTVLFSLTVWHIVQVTRLQQHSRVSDRRRVMTYVKLSTVTGLFWALAILSVRLDYTALNFLTSALVALQGLYIFLSFTVQRAVGLLYKELIWSKRAQDNNSRPNDLDGSVPQQR